jgi:hypothetical protein
LKHRFAKGFQLGLVQNHDVWMFFLNPGPDFFGQWSEVVQLSSLRSRGHGDRPHGPEITLVEMQEHHIHGDEFLKKLYGTPHGNLDIQTATYLHGRPVEKIIFVNAHCFFLLADEYSGFCLILQF